MELAVEKMGGNGGDPILFASFFCSFGRRYICMFLLKDKNFIR